MYVGARANDLVSHVRLFLKERDSEKYHNPEDLAESICIESAELLQLFQWIKPEKTEQFKNDPAKVQRIARAISFPFSKHMTAKRSYTEFGLNTSMNVLWRLVIVKKLLVYVRSRST